MICSKCMWYIADMEVAECDFHRKLNKYLKRRTSNLIFSNVSNLKTTLKVSDLYYKKLADDYCAWNGVFYLKFGSINLFKKYIFNFWLHMLRLKFLGVLTPYIRKILSPRMWSSLKNDPEIFQNAKFCRSKSSMSDIALIDLNTLNILGYLFFFIYSNKERL